MGKQYYEENKEKLQKMALSKKVLSKEKKMKKESMQKNRYWKMYQEEKENVKEYGKQYTEKI